MHDLKWSPAEKQIARAVHKRAREAELQETVAEFKRRAAAVATAQDMWDIAEFLEQRSREIDEKYDYRYSQLLIVFGRLIREGRVREEDLAGLSDEKLGWIRRMLSL
jgi:hypothetical protein